MINNNYNSIYSREDPIFDSVQRINNGRPSVINTRKENQRVALDN